MMENVKYGVQRVCAGLSARRACLDARGQGTVEYAILVGVLAVIAMIAIIAFKGKIGELWDAITSGVNGL